MLIFAQFYEQREACAARGVRAAILQMGTGEGKSIVIAMMAIYTVTHLRTNTDPKPKPKPKPEPNRNPDQVKHLGKRVHVLENNEGLLERDFASYAPFYL